MSSASEDAAVWAVVELMGHVRLAGRISEEEKFGGKLGRLDVPRADGSYVTQFFGAGSVYRITFVTEGVARHVARGSDPAPVRPWDFPKQLPAADPPDLPVATFYDQGDQEGDDDRPF